MSRTSDARYGRRGGRFEPGPVIDRAETYMAEIHHERLRAIKRGTWPTWADQEWHDRADKARHSGDTSGAAVRAIETSRVLTAHGRGRTRTSSGQAA